MLPIELNPAIDVPFQCQRGFHSQVKALFVEHREHPGESEVDQVAMCVCLLQLRPQGATEQLVPREHLTMYLETHLHLVLLQQIGHVLLLLLVAMQGLYFL